MTKLRQAGAHDEDEMTLDMFRVGWRQIVDAESARRLACPA